MSLDDEFVDDQMKRRIAARSDDGLITALVLSRQIFEVSLTLRDIKVVDNAVFPQPGFEPGLQLQGVPFSG
jgi:hypothetical protein